MEMMDLFFHPQSKLSRHFTIGPEMMFDALYSRDSQQRLSSFSKKLR